VIAVTLIQEQFPLTPALPTTAAPVTWMDNTLQMVGSIREPVVYQGVRQGHVYRHE